MRVLNKTKSHYSVLGKKGDDEFNVEIPDGFQFDATQLKILEKKSGGGARIQKQPTRGQTGQGKVKIHWWYNGMGKIRYRATADATKIPDGVTPRPETRIIDSSAKSHYSMLGKRGDDTVQIQLPSGFSFKKVAIIFLDGKGARIEHEPPAGSTGKLAFRVHWWYDAFGKVRYKLRVTAKRDAEYQLKCSGVSWIPDPVKAGRTATFSANLKNTGSKSISQLRIVGDAYATSMDDVPSVILDTLTSSQRTQNVYRSVESVDLEPGEETTLSIDVPIPKTISAKGQTVSTAGEYRVTLVAYLTTGPSVCSTVVASFNVTK